MTKEHIWPKSLIQRWESKLKTYNSQTGRFYAGEPVIKDVCKNCNNVQLSQLDQYLAEIYDDQLKEQVQAGNSVVFTYSYDLLLRSLLKISFNSCRATGDDKIAIAAHHKVKDYILGVSKRPKGFSIRLQIVTPSKLIGEAGEVINNQFSHNGMRCAKISFTGTKNNKGIQNNKFQIRLIAIKSFWFYLVIPIHKYTQQEKKRFIEEFKRWEIPPGVPIQPAHEKVVIPVEKTTYMHPLLFGTLLLSKH
ncbi:hypothetical protein PN441_01225 [Spirulina major CS-329]|nr:hypothetical protein [Spirulina major CS-329]